MEMCINVYLRFRSNCSLIIPPLQPTFLPPHTVSTFKYCFDNVFYNSIMYYGGLEVPMAGLISPLLAGKPTLMTCSQQDLTPKIHGKYP